MFITETEHAFNRTEMQLELAKHLFPYSAEKNILKKKNYKHMLIRNLNSSSCTNSLSPSKCRYIWEVSDLCEQRCIDMNVYQK